MTFGSSGEASGSISTKKSVLRSSSKVNPDPAHDRSRVDTDTPIDVRGLPLVSMADVLPLQKVLIEGIKAKGGPKEQFNATEDEFVRKRLGKAIVGQLKSRVYARVDTVFENVESALKED
jgi:hypothetical protein